MSLSLAGLSRSALMNKQVLVCVGPGGVGKTTTSAGLALEAAMEGRNVLVLTVDPARRLADALGLAEMLSSPTPISLPEHAKGRLSAMMLDPKRTFDEVIGRHAPDPGSRERLLNNPFYQEASRSLAGCQEYMAMEELFSLSSQGSYDLVILDTPPSRHALDFLDAPERLRGFFESRTFSLFMDSSSWVGKLTGKLLSERSPIMKGISKFVGGEALSDLLSFLRAFQGMTDGFSHRASRVDALLRSGQVGFIVVSGPDGTSLHEAGFLLNRIRTDRLHLDGVLINRARPRWMEEEALGELMKEEDGPSTAEKQAALAYHRIVAEDERNIARVMGELGPETPVGKVTHFAQSISDLDGLRRFAKKALGEEPVCL